jgi:photosystem II stability/assembly factor-like uncharacterized protein
LQEKGRLRRRVVGGYVWLASSSACYELEVARRSAVRSSLIMKPSPDDGSARPHLQLTILLTALLSLSSGAQRVFAHAGPQVREIRFQGGDQNPVLLSNRGLIFGASGPQNWALMCNEALGVNTAEVPELASFDDGRILAATSMGLKFTNDRGCSWQGVEPYGTLSAPSIVQDAKDPQRLFVTTFGDGAQSGVSRSSDGGKTWQRIFSVDDKDYLRYLLIAPSQPERIYVRSLSFGSGSDFRYQTLRSDDAGKTWQRFDLTLMNDTETDFVLLGVSPDDPDLVLAMAEAADPITNKERLLVSRDAGKTFAQVGSIQVITAVTWSSDHKTIYVAADEGLLRSTDNAQSFQRVGPAQYVSCVEEHDGVLLACGYYHGVAAGYPGIGMSTDGGETFNTWMTLNTVLMPVQCDAQAPTRATCGPLWVDWQREILGTVAVPDAGVADGGGQTGDGAAGTGAGREGNVVPETDASMAAGSGGGSDSDAGGTSSKKLNLSSCGCQSLGSRDAATRPFVLCLIAGFFAVWQRRRCARRFARLRASN